jgi:hypothetical protein
MTLPSTYNLKKKAQKAKDTIIMNCNTMLMISLKNVCVTNQWSIIWN